jgi:tetratricopeptide (TPR) repeat protein
MSAEAVRPLPLTEEVGTSRARLILPALAAFAPVFGLAAAQGGYFPTSWGWTSVPLLLTVAIAVIVRDQVRLGTTDTILLAVLAALVGWIALSAAWSVALDSTVLEVERALVYVGAVATVLVFARERSVRQVLGGLLVAISLIATFSLLTRLVPDRIGVYDRTAVYRLSQPIGYWNGLGIFAGMGALIALGFAARARTLAARAACGGALVVLLPTLYFTFGRAAWISLVVGLGVALLLDPRRLQLSAAIVVLGPLPSIAVLFASREHGLTHAGTPLARAAHDGHRLALILLFLVAANAVLAVALHLVARRVDVPRIARLVFGAVLGAILVAGLAIVFGRYGGPVTLAKKGYDSFKAPPPHASNLNRRLTSFSGNGRVDLWRIAWRDAAKHPVVGAGAGTYERYYLAHQPVHEGRVRDAHGLYIETLAELGPIGLGLLVATLVAPLALLRSARRHPLVPAAAGAYAAYLLHSGVDWDWELPGVTLVGLLCGASILLAARQWRPPRALSSWARVGVATLAAATAAFAALTLLGNAALSRSNTARADGHLVRAAADARRARALMPWSPRPWEALGQAQLSAGLAADARRSFRKAISMDDGDWRLWYDLANASTGKAEHRALRRAVALFPRSGLLRTAQAKGAAR